MNFKPLRVVFMGTPKFSVPSLKAIINAGHDILAVYTQPPSRYGRGKLKQPTDIAKVANNFGLDVKEPNSLRTPECYQEFIRLDPDIAVVVAYGQILPPEFLNHPKFGCVNAHASLLPRWRGAAPIQRAIMAGDSTTGITIMQMTDKLDAGAILASHSVKINDQMNFEDLHSRLSLLAADLLPKTIDGLVMNKIDAVPQSSSNVTYAHKIIKTEAEIDWALSAKEILLKVRALNPTPGAWFSYKGERIKVLNGYLEYNHNSKEIGSIWELPSKGLCVMCGENSVLVITQLQRAGKKPLDIDVFLRGMRFEDKLPLKCQDIN